MPLPTPPVKVDGGCSGIFENTVYTYQSNAFQSLRLEEGAKWSKLNMGVAVDKAKCVIGAVDGQDALFVVGGISKENNYSGLQRYTFGDKQWRTIDIPDPNLQNREMHGAAYLESTKSLLVYAGYQDGKVQNSSQTFTISATSPYVPRSYTSKAPPGMDPILLPWNTSHAVMAGGSPSNQQVWVFSESNGWTGVPIVLPPSQIDMTKVQASLVQGDNSSKILELFDLNQSPNKVTALMVQPAAGQSLANDQASSLVSRTTVRSLEPDYISEKAVDLADLPRYDDSQAPKDIRTSYSLAQSAAGLVVITGGDGSQDPLAIFNQTGNAWVDAQKFFDPSFASSTSSSTSSSATSSASPTGAATGVSASETNTSSGTNNTRIILGSVLGGLFGIAAICIIILLFFRRHKARKQRSQNEFVVDQGRQMEMDSNGARLESLTGSTESLKRGYVAKDMISNPRIQDEKTSPDRGLTAFPSVFANADAANDRAPRDQGWSQYFATDSQNQNHANHTSGVPTHDTSDSRLTQYTEGSEYTNNSSHLHESAEVPPLNIRASQLPAANYYGNDNETFLGTSSSEQDSYDPIGTSRGTWDQRPPSSIYAESGPHPGQRVLISQFPGVPASRRVSEVSPIENEDRGMRTMASRDFGGGARMPLTTNAGAVRMVTGSAEPRSAGDVYSRKGTGDDMSWLNLGNNR